MTVASERLHAAIVEQRLRHNGDPALTLHVSQAVAQATGRGWRLSKMARDAQIDAAIALCMAVERAEHRPAPVPLLGRI
jgi:phage terminase large subunit-like protein